LSNQVNIQAILSAEELVILTIVSGHSRFSQTPSLKKLLQQRFGYFSKPNKDKKRSWRHFEGIFPELFLIY